MSSFEKKIIGKADKAAMGSSQVMNPKLNVLLLTNRDSDNIGDQVIERCSIDIISTILRNLGYKKSDFKVTTRAAGMVSKKYMATLDSDLHEVLENKIKEADIIVFGGAPLFNFAYQSFYKRTIITLDLARKHDIPVIFSSIGVEKYDGQNSKCIELKEALHHPNVISITTRDDYESLAKYQDGASFEIAKVADPAVFCDIILSKFKLTPPKKPTVGFSVVRHKIFKDNDIDFPKEKQMDFWMSLRETYIQQGYDVKFFTTGHFTDEAFLDALMRKYSLDSKECIFNMNNPEKLTKIISSFSGIVSYRLHASIVAYALGVPAVGLTWNQKVPLFYESINYPERAFSVEDWNAETINSALNKAMEEGVSYDEEYAMTLYNTLFDSMKQVLKPSDDIRAYTYEELVSELPRFDGTSQKEQDNKDIRKQRRTYEAFNKLEEELGVRANQKRKLEVQEKQINSVKFLYKRLFKLLKIRLLEKFKRPRI